MCVGGGEEAPPECTQCKVCVVCVCVGGGGHTVQGVCGVCVGRGGGTEEGRKV